MFATHNLSHPQREKTHSHQFPRAGKFVLHVRNVLLFSAFSTTNFPCYTVYGGVTGVLQIADIGLFWVRKCRKQSSFLRIADNAYIFEECRYFCKLVLFAKTYSIKFDASFVKILCNIDLKDVKTRKEYISRRSEDNCHNY